MNAQCNPAINHCYIDDIQRQNNTGRTKNPLRRALQSIAERRRQRLNRLAIRELVTLDDETLKDIGISRDDIRWASKLPLSTNAAVELEVLARRR